MINFKFKYTIVVKEHNTFKFWNIENQTISYRNFMISSVITDGIEIFIVGFPSVFAGKQKSCSKKWDEYFSQF